MWSQTAAAAIMQHSCKAGTTHHGWHAPFTCIMLVHTHASGICMPWSDTLGSSSAAADGLHVHGLRYAAWCTHAPKSSAAQTMVWHAITHSCTCRLCANLLEGGVTPSYGQKHAYVYDMPMVHACMHELACCTGHACSLLYIFSCVTPNLHCSACCALTCSVM